MTGRSGDPLRRRISFAWSCEEGVSCGDDEETGCIRLMRKSAVTIDHTRSDFEVAMLAIVRGRERCACT